MLHRIGRRIAVQKLEDEGEHKGEDAPEEQPRLTAVGPDRPKYDPKTAAGADGRDVARKIAIARVCVRSGQAKTAQLRFDRASICAREDVDARAGGVEGERVRETCALGLDFVALRTFGLKPPDEIVMVIGGRAGRPVRIVAGVAKVIQKARIIHAAGLEIERHIDGARDRHRRLDAGRSIDARHDHALKRLAAGRSGTAELSDRLRQTPQRESLAGAGRP